VWYPSWIIAQKWDDVLALYNERYNGGYNFSRISWYRDGEPIEGKGDHNSYLYELPTLQFGVPYWALLTRTDDGKSIRTCSCVPVQKSKKEVGERIRLVPVGNGESRTWKVETELNGTYCIYDITGKYLYDNHFGEEWGDPNIVFEPSYSAGTYLIQFQATDGTKEVKKVAVH